jgi:hypothetical protein
LLLADGQGSDGLAYSSRVFRRLCITLLAKLFPPPKMVQWHKQFFVVVYLPNISAHHIIFFHDNQCETLLYFVNTFTGASSGDMGATP